MACPEEFWADVRTISQKLGYARNGEFVVPDAARIEEAYQALALDGSHVVVNGRLTDYGQALYEYFTYRAQILTTHVQHQLMDAAAANALFVDHLRRIQPPNSLIPMNKQTGDKKAPALRDS